MTIDQSVHMARENLISAFALLMEYGPEVRLSKREMDVFELGVYLGQAATLENQGRRASRSTASVTSRRTG